MNAYAGAENKAKKIKSVYVGVDGVARKVKKSYIGVNGIARLFFSAKPMQQSRLPAGYAEIEYIDNTNLTYIADIGAPKSLEGYRFEFRIEENSISGTSSFNVFGNYCQQNPSSITYRYSYYNRIYLAATMSAKKVILEYGKRTGTTTPQYTIGLEYTDTDILEITVDISNALFAVNAKQAALVGKKSYLHSQAKNLTSALFAANRAYTARDNGADMQYYNGLNPSPIKLYSLKISKSATGEVYREYVPCINPDNIVGLYELVQKKFYGATGDKSFLAGPSIFT